MAIAWGLHLGCPDSVQGDLGAGWRTRAVAAHEKVGALYLLGAQVRINHAGTFTGVGFRKVLAVVEPRQTVTIEIPPSQRGSVSLAYDPHRVLSTVLKITDGVSAVTFRACPDRETQFAGGFLIRGGTDTFSVLIHTGGVRRKLLLPG